MFESTQSFSGFSVNDIDIAMVFYGETLGVQIEETPQGLKLNTAGTSGVFIYSKGEAHVPATFTVLNFVVEDIDAAVAGLKSKGITLESVEGITGDDGIARGIEAHRGPDIAWFKDPAGNFLSVLKND